MTFENLNSAILEFIKKAMSDNETLKSKLWDFLKLEMDSASQQLDLADWTYFFLQIQSEQQQKKHIHQIIEEMKGNGVILPSGNVAMILSSKLRRDSRFKFTQRDGWEINKGESNAAASQGNSCEISDDAAGIIADQVYTNLKGTQSINDLRNYVRANATGVPYNVDVELLRKFKTMYQRFAMGDEKIKLRTAIIEVFKKEERLN